MPLQHLIDSFNTRFITKNELTEAPFRYDGHRRKVLLFQALRQIDTQILMGKIEEAEGHAHALLLKPDLVEGGWYDSDNPVTPILEAG